MPVWSRELEDQNSNGIVFGWEFEEWSEAATTRRRLVQFRKHLGGEASVKICLGISSEWCVYQKDSYET